MKRTRNPAGTTIAVIAATSGAVVAGLGAYLWRRSRRVPVAPTEDLPSVVDDEDTPEYGESRWSWGRASDPGYPWNKRLLHVENYPTPGMFFDVGDKGGSFDPDQGFDELVIALLSSALTMAGMDPDKAMALARAQGQDSDALVGRRLRRDVRRALVEPGSWNDLLFGQTNANLAGGTAPGLPCTEGSGTTNAACTDGIRDPNAKPVTYMMNAAGRGLNWLPRHTNVLDALGGNERPSRGTSLDGESLGLGTSHMVLWMPAFDLVELAKPERRIQLMPWPGGSSTVDPPPVVMSLGIDRRGVMLPMPQEATVA